MPLRMSNGGVFFGSKCCYYDESWLDCDITFCTFDEEYFLIVGGFVEMDLHCS